MNTLIRRLVRFVLLLALVMSAMPAAAQDEGGAVALQVTGRFGRAGTFEGTATINKFAVDDDNKIVAIGFVQGTVRRGDRTIGSVLKGPVTWRVAVRARSVVPVKGGAPATARPLRVGWTLAQAEPCPVLQVALGPADVNLLGIDVVLSPVALDLTGVAGTPLGELVCQVSDLLVNIGGLVGLLNEILGLLTGLLGGLTGGLGGAVPTIP